jgi:NAD(P)H-hydrate epimerase
LERLTRISESITHEIQNPSDLPTPEPGSIIIDAIFGTGLTRNTDGLAGDIIDQINNCNATIISLDLPSGIYSNETSIRPGNKIIKANQTLTFQYLKPALLVSENASFYGTVEVLDIGLMHEALKSMKVKFYQSDQSFIASIYKPRPNFRTKAHTVIHDHCGR